MRRDRKTAEEISEEEKKLSRVNMLLDFRDELCPCTTSEVSGYGPHGAPSGVAVRGNVGVSVGKVFFPCKNHLKFYNAWPEVSYDEVLKIYGRK